MQVDTITKSSQRLRIYITFVYIFNETIASLAQNVEQRVENKLLVQNGVNTRVYMMGVIQ